MTFTGHFMHLGQGRCPGAQRFTDLLKLLHIPT